MTDELAMTTEKQANSTTATTCETAPVSAEAMMKAIREIDLLPKSTEWVLIDPHGRVYEGNIEDIALIVMNEHPLLKMPSPIDVFRMW